MRVMIRFQQVRNSNFELLRIVSILLIIAMHVIGYAASKGELSDSNQYIRFFIGSFGNLGVGCFVLISGYFGVKYTTRKFVFISWLTTVYAILCAWANNDFSVTRDCVMAITNVPRYFNWYITCYLILMALSGYINCFVESLTKNEFKRLLMILFLFFSVLPMMGSATETALLKSGQCVTYFIYAYLIGRYIRLHRDIDVPKAKSVLMTLVFIAMLFTIKVAGMYVSAIDAIPVMSNNSPLILGAVVSVFYLFKSFNFKSKIVNKILPQVKDAGLSYFFRIQIWKPSFSHVFLYKFRKRYMANFRRIVEYAEAKYERERKNEIAMEGVIPPVEYAEIMRHTACVLDTDRGSQSGITPRVIWALAMGKKIISTNRNLLRAPFYSPEQIFIIDRESPVIDIDFIKDNRTFSIHPEIEKARLDKWVKNFIED